MDLTKIYARSPLTRGLRPLKILVYDEDGAHND